MKIKTKWVWAYFSEKSEFVKLKTEVKEIIIFYSYVICSKKNVENRRKSWESCIKCKLTSSFDDNKKFFQELRNMAILKV